MVRIQNMTPLAFNLIPWEFFEKLIILSKMDEDNFFKKCVLELCRTAMIKPRQIERSGFFLLGHNRQTQIYRLVRGPLAVWFRSPPTTPYPIRVHLDFWETNMNLCPFFFFISEVDVMVWIFLCAVAYKLSLINKLQSSEWDVWLL